MLIMRRTHSEMEPTTMESNLGKLIAGQSNLMRQSTLDFARMAATVSADDRAAVIKEFAAKARLVAAQLTNAANEALSFINGG